MSAGRAASGAGALTLLPRPASRCAASRYAASRYAASRCSPARLATVLVLAATVFGCFPAAAQVFHFSLRAEPDVIPANGISTSTIVVQVQDTGTAAIAPT